MSSSRLGRVSLVFADIICHLKVTFSLDLIFCVYISECGFVVLVHDSGIRNTDNG